MKKTWFAIDERTSRPLLNGDMVSDHDNNAYTFISFTPPDDGMGGMFGARGTVTVKDDSGKLTTTTRFPFSIRFEYEYDEPVSEASNQHPNCDGSGPCSAGEVRFLATGRCSMDGGVILCRSCFTREMAWRKHRNQTLASDCRFLLPAWTDLPVYGGSGGVK